MRTVQLLVLAALCGAMPAWADPAKVYWGEYTGTIKRANLDGSGAQTLHTDQGRVASIVVDADSEKMYWSHSSLGPGGVPSGGIRRSNLDGTQVEELVTTSVAPFQIALQPSTGRMIWADGALHRILSADLDGSDVQEVVSSGVDNPYGVAIDEVHGKLYWSDFWGAGRLMRSNLDGSAPQVVLTGIPEVQGITLSPDGLAILVAGHLDNVILRVPIAGGATTTFATASAGPHNIAADLVGGKLYWTLRHTNTIARANFDGSGVQSAVTALGPEALAILPATICGNGRVQSGEACDDGNTLPGDCCSPTCQYEAIGSACASDGLPCSTDVCNGAGTCTHPAAQSGTLCRAAAGACDAAETCDGSALGCPGDAKSTAMCRAAAGPCDVAEVCDGLGDACPADVLAPSGTLCRGAAGVCDVAEICTGVDAACPADAKSVAVCRPAGDVCDLAEGCDGAGDDCPADLFRSAGTACREAAGVCDVAETCSGGSAACPGDVFRSSSEVCRTSAGACDVDETCSGASAACPGDGFAALGTPCRPPANDCDRAESCAGTAPDCPADAAQPDGTSCDDGDACTQTDRCSGGACAGSDALDCDDGNPCSRDTCEAAGGCVHDDAPATGCRSAGRSVLLLRNVGDDPRDRLLWKWTRGDAAAQGDWGSAVTLCLYAGSADALVGHASLPDGSAWSPIGSKGWKFRDASGQPDGIATGVLKGGAGGHSKIIVKGTGANLPDVLAAGALELPVRVQMQSSSASCFESLFPAASANDGTQFRAKVP